MPKEKQDTEGIWKCMKKEEATSECFQQEGSRDWEKLVRVQDLVSKKLRRL